ncbi:MAG: hypothetical protein FK734_02745 [Asgard group archaeon]|nr:hypothetical protein [Asgard group archaeon]
MIFKELIATYKWDDLTHDFLKLYPEETKKLKKYKKVLATLQNINQEITKENLQLLIVKIKEKDGKIWYDVSGFKENDPLLFSLAMTPWEEWLSMEIHPETFENCSQKEIIIHSIWEMTFYGFKQKKIQSLKAKINKQSQNAGGK